VILLRLNSVHVDVAGFQIKTLFNTDTTIQAFIL